MAVSTFFTLYVLMLLLRGELPRHDFLQCGARRCGEQPDVWRYMEDARWSCPGLGAQIYDPSMGCFAATIGLILRSVSERVGILEKVVAGLVGLASSLAIYFIVPVLAF